MSGRMARMRSKVFGEAMEGAYKALEKLRDEKVVKAIGVGINEVAVSEQIRPGR